MNIHQYLHRIGIDQIEEPSYAFLAGLQERHLLTVPFENLDIVQGEKIVLDHERLYEKIVLRRRGGFCYELNGLFYWLLRQLGFSVSMLSAAVYNATTGRYGREFDHMTLLVRLEKSYLVDVGFGDSFRRPMILPDGVIEDISGFYRVVDGEPSQAEYVLQRHEENGWHPEYRFATAPRAFSDYAEMCLYHQLSPTSTFTQRVVCTIATKYGRVTLSDDSLTITKDKIKRRRPVGSPEASGRMLREYFGIEFPNWAETLHQWKGRQGL